LKLSHIFPYLVRGGTEYSLLEPLSLVSVGATYDIIEIRLGYRLGLISVWEEKITLNDIERTTYRSEYKPDVIRAVDCRSQLARHLDSNADLFNQDSRERIKWFRSYVEET
jgi:hypothetical protein